MIYCVYNPTNPETNLKIIKCTFQFLCSHFRQFSNADLLVPTLNTPHCQYHDPVRLQTTFLYDKLLKFKI